MPSVERGAAVIAAAAVRLGAEADRFRALDAEVGDGDLGVTVAAGCAAVGEALHAGPPADFGELFATVGRAFAAANPSTMANLVGIAMRRVSRSAGDSSEIAAADWPELLGAAIAAIERRGGAALGEKTILDALDGSRTALVALGPDAGGAEQVSAARDGAAMAAAAIVPLRARAGRAAWQGERTRGLPDPGAELWAAASAALAAAVVPSG